MLRKISFRLACFASTIILTLAVALSYLALFKPKAFDAVFVKENGIISEISLSIKTNLSLQRNFSARKNIPWGSSYCVFPAENDPIQFLKDKKLNYIYTDTGPIMSWNDNNWHFVVIDKNNNAYLISVESFMFPLSARFGCFEDFYMRFDEKNHHYFIESPKGMQ